MSYVSLTQIALFLVAAVVAAPLAQTLRIGKALGYLLAGVLIGPFGLGFVYSVYQVDSILHFAEFGVVLLLFVIGLELRPLRLWAMRHAVFLFGGSQVAVTAVALALIGFVAGLAWPAAVFAGLALALSSTAFALQVLEERGEIGLRHGRLAFATLLFQDLAAIPLIALVPLFSVSGAGKLDMGFVAALRAIAVIATVIIAGRFLLARVFRLVARTQVKEAMTASALLTVVGITLVMERAGLSAALGAFIAGALLADSEYRHQIEADIAPFQGLLLGLFFTAVGMSLNLTLIVGQPLMVLMIVVVLVLVKASVLYLLARRQGLEPRSSRRLALVLSQGGEFAFVLFSAGATAGVLGRPAADLLSVAVTISMAATPILLLVDGLWAPRKTAGRDYDPLPNRQRHVVIAGFGRVGQIVARILRAKRIPFTALDASVEQVDFIRRFDDQIYYGDASRSDILDAARINEARAFVLAIDDIETSLRTAEMVQQRYPHVPIFARARNRQHAMRLLELGIESVRRETFLSSLELTRDLLRGLGETERDVRFAINTFRELDERRLHEDARQATDTARMEARARSYTKELEEMFERDEAEQDAVLKAEKS